MSESKQEVEHPTTPVKDLDTGIKEMPKAKRDSSGRKKRLKFKLMHCGTAGCILPVAEGSNRFCADHLSGSKNIAAAKSKQKVKAKKDPDLVGAKLADVLAAIDLDAERKLDELMGTESLTTIPDDDIRLILDLLDGKSIGLLRTTEKAIHANALVIEANSRARKLHAVNAIKAAFTAGAEAAADVDVGEGDEEAPIDRILAADEDHLWFLVQWAGLPVTRSSWVARRGLTEETLQEFLGVDN